MDMHMNEQSNDGMEELIKQKKALEKTVVDSIAKVKELGEKIEEIRRKRPVICPICGKEIALQWRRYASDDGYDSPSRWLTEYEIIHCKNCGYFDWDYHPRRVENWTRAEYDRACANDPSNDPDNKAWKIAKKALDAVKKAKDECEKHI
jgi:hypothetical protein